MTKYILIILIISNILAFILMGVDKKRAISQKYRISEKLLITLSIAFCAFGIYLGMILFHHKTKKMKFYIFIPLLMMLQLVVIYYLLAI